MDIFDIRNIPGITIFPITHTVPDTTAGTRANYGRFLIAPFPCFVMEVRECHTSAASEPALLDIEVLRGATAEGSGVSAIESTFNLTSTANTSVKIESNINSTLSVFNRYLAAGDSLALKASGDVYGMDNLTITILLGVKLKDFRT